MITKQYLAKLAERVVWTAIQASLGVVTVVVTDLPPVWAPVIATLLAVVKGFVARKIGDPQDPATLPAGV